MDRAPSRAPMIRVPGWWTAAQARFFPAGSLRARLARGSLWSTFGTLVQQAAGMVSAIVTARLLGESAFGELGLVRSTVLTFGVLAGSGLGLATTKFVAEHRSTDPARAGRLLGLLFAVAFTLSGAATLACVLLAHPLAAATMHAAGLSGPLRVGALLLFLGTVGGVQLGALNGLEDFRTGALLLLADAFLALAGVVAGTLAFGLTGAVAGAVVAAAVAFPLKQAFVRRRCAAAGIRISYRGAWRESRALGTFILPAVLLGVATQPFEWLARVQLARRPQGFAELGLFTAAYAWGQVVQFVPAQVTGPSMPILANLYGRRDRAGFLRLLRIVAGLTAGCGFAVALVLAAASPWILRAYGAAFAGGWRVLALVAVAYALAAVSSLFRATLVATGLMWWQNAHAAIWGVTLAGSFALLARFGATGLAGSYLAAYAVIVVTQGTSAWIAVRDLEPPAERPGA